MSFTEVILAPFRLPNWQTALLFGVVGALLTAWFTRRALRDCEEPDRGWSIRAALAAVFCCGVFTWCMLIWKVQEIDEVRSSEIWWYWRVGHHVVLIALMLAATATDLRAYLIPDSLVRFGLIYAVVLAGLSGDLQVQQVWVDWNEEIPQLQGPYLPAWLSQYPHLHGIAWSLAGAACGALGTWIIRAVASLALGQEAMGFGDVTLMAMIGAFLGWQPTVIVLVLAPLCGLAVSVLLLVAGAARGLLGAAIPSIRSSEHAKSYLPYGPLLCLATYIVLLTWRRVWKFELQLSGDSPIGDRVNTFAVRRLFGDWVSLLLIAGVTLIALLVVLFLRRLYRNLPVNRRSDSGLESPADVVQDRSNEASGPDETDHNDREAEEPLS